jgi:cell division protein FtsB
MSFRSVFNKIFSAIKAVVLNKYIIVLVTFGIYITFFDQHNLINRWESNRKIKELNEEYKYYEGEIDKNKKELQRLQNDNQYLEKYAREKYLMRNKGEEIFIIKED